MMPTIVPRPANVVYGLAALAILAAVILHAPWSGYTTSFMPDKVDTLTLLRECPDIARTSSLETTQAEVEKRFETNFACASKLAPVAVPIKITRWRSREPLVYEFGRLRNVAAGILLVAVGGFLFGKGLDWALADMGGSGNSRGARPARR
jgi:hypothetical protein